MRIHVVSFCEAECKIIPRIWVFNSLIIIIYKYRELTALLILTTRETNTDTWIDYDNYNLACEKRWVLSCDLEANKVWACRTEKWRLFQTIQCNPIHPKNFNHPTRGDQWKKRRTVLAVSCVCSEYERYVIISRGAENAWWDEYFFFSSLVIYSVLIVVISFIISCFFFF